MQKSGWMSCVVGFPNGVPRHTLILGRAAAKLAGLGPAGGTFELDAEEAHSESYGSDSAGMPKPSFLRTQRALPPRRKRQEEFCQDRTTRSFVSRSSLPFVEKQILGERSAAENDEHNDQQSAQSHAQH